MIIRELSASLRALFGRLTAKTSTIAGTETVYIDDAGTSKKATLSNAIRYGGGSPRTETIGNATVTQTTTGALYLEGPGRRRATPEAQERWIGRPIAAPRRKWFLLHTASRSERVI